MIDIILIDIYHMSIIRNDFMRIFLEKEMKLARSNFCR